MTTTTDSEAHQLHHRKSERARTFLDGGRWLDSVQERVTLSSKEEAARTKYRDALSTPLQAASCVINERILLGNDDNEEEDRLGLVLPCTSIKRIKDRLTETGFKLLR